ncbi:HAD family hydrolase [Halogeometricum borinquense]|uniref:HAD family hydrolase n=1 Tax=Halogeometricum borinquense TaxID=60847 RepID=A0A6C0UHF0_9EURY|nr:HAD hydrolase-like protein [Halogeometricum borinquense]QIB74912.1 HAD family hydrolase [Halogeometricum borinquense]QIQ76088.1 HAD family hydrolase [Halogeometricum borinquense]
MPTCDLAPFDAVVWDLDGTLVHLDVDWGAVATEAEATFRAAGIDADGTDLWGMLDLADESDMREDIEAILSAHEREGARRSKRLACADTMGTFEVEGVCSLNCEAACHVALDTHDLAGHADAVVGRDSVETRKPDPEPLLETLRRMDAAPDDAVFVGDSRRDKLTAERAGVAFRYVGDGPSGV